MFAQLRETSRNFDIAAPRGLSEAVRCIAGSLAAGMTRREILATLLACGDGDALRDVIARLAAVG